MDMQNLQRCAYSEFSAVVHVLKNTQNFFPSAYQSYTWLYIFSMPFRASSFLPIASEHFIYH